MQIGFIRPKYDRTKSKDQKHKFNAYGSRKLNYLTFNMRFNSNVGPQKRVFILVTNHKLDLWVELESRAALGIIQLEEP